MRYLILHRTPFPGYFESLPEWQLQQAEFDLHFGRFYYERATKLPTAQLDPLILYSWEDANLILDYWRAKRSWAEYSLLGYMGETT